MRVRGKVRDINFIIPSKKNFFSFVLRQKGTFQNMIVKRKQKALKYVRLPVFIFYRKRVQMALCALNFPDRKLQGKDVV